MVHLKITLPILLILIAYTHFRSSPVEISTLSNPTNAPSEIFNQNCIKDTQVIYSFTNLLGVLITSGLYDETRELQHAATAYTLYYKLQNLGTVTDIDQVTRNDIEKWQNYLRLYLSKEDFEGNVEPICEIQVLKIQNGDKDVVLTYGTDLEKVEKVQYENLIKREWDLVQKSNEYGFKDLEWDKILVLSGVIIGTGKLIKLIGF
ncbi:putative secreted protein [Wickerhamomyces ciferrii]|uniref:Secreted protein n=1 Tax=Wickerhamomyces ciferrii (strain ATCC 14091 / BCRC 22168 / CBS 111 / JCM 3599 / NBRC 0793 / NRRL Y-1031 F-60-10) TaxID=1206466 RepID=K0KQ48_WICCF|nr:uncharacterized protein BN7_2866 [Wickerhamomyces ciferrii]CCH43318.1 putative secreted protein [Wickerhamomyces ciferrii]